MLYANIDDWISYYADANNVKEENIQVEVFNQPFVINSKLQTTVVTVIYNKNFEIVDIYFNENYAYTVYNPNDKFKEDFNKKQLLQTEKEYMDL